MFNKIKKTNKIVKFIAISIAIFFIFAGTMPVLAQEDVTDPTPGGMDTGKIKEDPLGSFKVSEWLKIPDGQTYLDPEKIDDTNKVGLKNGLVYFVVRLIELLTKIIGSFALLFLITGGLILMASHGNSQLQTRGKQMILYSLLGIVIAFGSLIIVTFVQSLFFTM